MKHHNHAPGAGTCSSFNHNQPATLRPHRESLPSTRLRLGDEQVEVEPGGGARGQQRRNRALRRREVVALVGRPLRAAGRGEDVGHAPDLRLGRSRGAKPWQCSMLAVAQAEGQEAPRSSSGAAGDVRPPTRLRSWK